jgi:hypothetical protein
MSQHLLNGSLADFGCLQSFFLSLKRPYRPGEVVRFNRAYLRMYRELTSEQRMRANEWADTLVADKKADHACRPGEC